MHPEKCVLSTRRYASCPSASVTDFIQSHDNARAVVFIIAYEWMVISNNDPIVLFMEDGLRIRLEAAQSRRWLVKIISLLRYVGLDARAGFG